MSTLSSGLFGVNADRKSDALDVVKANAGGSIVESSMVAAAPVMLKAVG